MKKFIALALLMFIIATGAFAMDRAIGFGALGGLTFQSGKGYLDGSLARYSGCIFGFFGPNQYTEINLSLLYKDTNEDVYTWGGSETLFPSTWALQLGVYGKYPFVLSDSLVFFPTAGVDFEWSFDMDYWWSDLWIRAGIGMDIFISQTMFMRNHIIYGAAIPITTYDDLDIKVGHGLLVKLGLGWMF